MANQPSSRKWIIEPIVTEEAIISIDDQVAARLARLSIVLADIGGTIGVVAERELVEEPDRYETVRVIIRWESFAPARRPRPVAKQELEVAEEPEAESPEPAEEPEPEPAAA